MNHGCVVLFSRYAVTKRFVARCTTTATNGGRRVATPARAIVFLLALRLRWRPAVARKPLGAVRLPLLSHRPTGKMRSRCSRLRAVWIPCCGYSHRYPLTAAEWA